MPNISLKKKIATVYCGYFYIQCVNKSYRKNYLIVLEISLSNHIDCLSLYYRWYFKSRTNKRSSHLCLELLFVITPKTRKPHRNAAFVKNLYINYFKFLSIGFATLGSIMTVSCSKSNLMRHFCKVFTPMMASSLNAGTTINSSLRRISP